MTSIVRGVTATGSRAGPARACRARVLVAHGRATQSRRASRGDADRGYLFPAAVPPLVDGDSADQKCSWHRAAEGQSIPSVRSSCAVVDAQNAELADSTAEQIARLRRCLLTVVVGGGYTPALRWCLTVMDGQRAFLKQAVEESVVGRLRFEAWVYEHLGGPWHPRLAGFDDGLAPILVLEDLRTVIGRRCDEQPTWRRFLRRCNRWLLIGRLRIRREHWTPPWLKRWPPVAHDPAPFLRVGLCSTGHESRRAPVGCSYGRSTRGQTPSVFVVASNRLGES